MLHSHDFEARRMSEGGHGSSDPGRAPRGFVLGLALTAPMWLALACWYFAA